MADELIVSKPEPLADADRNRIKILEAFVENGVNSALDALEEIKRDRLYRDEYPSFEEYIRGRWGKSNRYLRRFLSFFEVRTLLEDNVVSAGELTERGARELTTNTTPEEQVDTAKAIKAEGNPLTSTNIRKEKQKRGKAKPVKNSKAVEQDQPKKSEPNQPESKPAEPAEDAKLVTLVKLVQGEMPLLSRLVEMYVADFVEVFQQTYPGIAWPDFARSLSDAFASIGKANKAEAIKAAEANQRVKQKDELVQHEPQKKAKDALRTTKVSTGVVAEQQTSVILNESCGALGKKTDRPALPQTKLEETVVAS